jgi:hypothetical protein
MASASVMPRVSGTSLAIRSTSPYGIPSTRPTSRIAARACSFPKVMIWATRRPSSPRSASSYLSRTYWITWSRPRMQKSTSMSGMEMRSGFRKRSKMMSYSMGSTPVIPSDQAAKLPAEEPRPGPTGTSLRRA